MSVRTTKLNAKYPSMHAAARVAMRSYSSDSDNADLYDRLADKVCQVHESLVKVAIADIVRRVEEANASPVIDFSTRGYESRKVKDELQKIKEEYGIK